MHWVILLPYYFVGALAALPFLIVVARLMRTKVPINALVGAAIVLSLLGIIVPLATGWAHRGDFTGRPLLLHPVRKPSSHHTRLWRENVGYKRRIY